MAEATAQRRVARILRRDLWISAAPIVLAVVAAFLFAMRFIKPAPPRRVTIAVAPDEGGAGWFAKKYQEVLAKNGVTLDVHQTQGSLTNLDLVSYPSDVSVAFVQSGTPPAEQQGGVISLGALTYVPLWVFYRGEPIDDLRALQGKRIAAGHPLSGTRALTKTLLKASNTDAQLLTMNRDEAAEQLRAGAIDAAFFVAPAESPQIKKLAAAPGVRLMSFSRADAYVRRFPYLSKHVLPRGVFDLAADVPDHDVVLLSPTLSLLARDSLHPALAYLLMRAATQIHGSAGILDDAGEFPAAREAGFPLSSEAARYYKSGAPFLQRYLPFWAANLVDRLWVMLVPIIAVLIPLGRAVPSIYRWRVRSRLYRWYARLKELELELDEQPSEQSLTKMLERLDAIERAVHRIRTPLAYTDNLYNFRQHVDVVRNRILRQLGRSP